MKLNKEEKATIKEISKLFNQIEDLYNTLPDETKDKILEYHNENYSLPHCVRWGLQPSDELTRLN
jgi:putative SOS response-associated peptidase YedK